MRNFILGILITAVIVLGITNFLSYKTSRKTELQSSDLILDQINNVGKLIVTEGHFSEVITYKDVQKRFNIIPSEKKAIVVVNADVTIAYDLSQIKHDMNPTTKTLTITNIPKAEINITPKITYHSLDEGLFNPFTAKDHNLIREKVSKQLNEKIKTSNLTSNAENRLLSELQKIYILTNSLGWKLIYNGSTIETMEELKP